MFEDLAVLMMQIEELKRAEDSSENIKIRLLLNSIKILKTMGQSINEFSLRIEQKIETINNITQKVIDKCGEVETRVSNIAAKQTAYEHNLEQVRILNERIAEKIENISSEFIERYIKEPMIKDIGLIYNKVFADAKTNKDKDGINFLLPQIAQVLEAYNVKIIEPKKGEIFNPRENKPIKTEPISEKEKNNQIYETLRAGFALNGNVIQQALVSLYSYDERLNINQDRKEDEVICQGE